MLDDPITCETLQTLLLEQGPAGHDPAFQAVRDRHLSTCDACRAAFEWESRLATKIRALASPIPVTQLAHVVRGKLSRRRRRILASSSLLAACVVVGATILATRQWAVSNEVLVVESSRPAPGKTRDDFQELAALFEPPPVDSFDVLARQQNGYVAVLKRASKEQ